MSFKDLNLKGFLLKAIEEVGYENPTEIQTKVIPLVLEKKDIIGKSHTGSGKTAAFVLPILQLINPNFKRPQALIICPTRELAHQVFNQVKKYSAHQQNVRSVLICGGQKRAPQVKMLKFCNIIIGTPGRIVDHINHGALKLDHLKYVVLDEADEMLKLGFKKDMDYLFTLLPKERQTLLFSATIPKTIQEMSRTYQNEPIMVEIDNSQKLHEKIEQFYINTFGNNKSEVLVKLFEHFKPELSIVFCNTKIFTEKIARVLAENNINASVINGDKTQWERNNSMDKFRNKHVQVLVATDVAARGLDINGIDYVFNFDIPLEQEVYVHRIGRTARAGATGISVTLVSNGKEMQEIKKIEHYQRNQMKRLELKDIGMSNKNNYGQNFHNKKPHY